MINHRLGQRVDISIPVRMRLPDASQCVGLALNVGWGGIFVRTSAPLPSAGCIDVFMTLRAADRAHRVRMPGLIVHQSNAGVGLMFRRLDGEAAEVLSWLLSAEEPATPRPAAGLARLEHGFLRVRCEVCHQERLVAFSCKRRGFCPRCGARHMVESAALI